MRTRASPRHLSLAEELAIVAEYEEQRKTEYQIAAEWKLSQPRVSIVLRKHGTETIPSHIRRMVPDRVAEACVMDYMNGLSLAEIAKGCHWSISAVRKAILRKGVRLRPQRRYRRMCS